VPREQEDPAYWVTGQEWLALAEQFGLTAQLEDTNAKSGHSGAMVVGTNWDGSSCLAS
jgi:hypothetical protein